MGTLRPTFWRTCRVIACETRLRLLWLLFENSGLCVSDLAQRVGISEKTAGFQLRSLNARGLITARRKALKVFYSPEANTEVAFSAVLLDALRDCHVRKMPFDTIVRQATAFTHARRIEIAHALQGSPATRGELQKRTGISAPALSLHLRKLGARHFVKQTDEKYRLNTPSNPLGRVLLQLVRAQPFSEADNTKKCA